MVPTRVTGPLWTHAGGCRTHTVDLDLQVPSPCLTEAGGGLAADPSGRTGKNLGCSTPRTVLFPDLGDTQEAWELSSERWLPPPGSGVAGGQPLKPKCYPYIPVNIAMVLVLPEWGLLGVVPSPLPSVWARNICAQQQDLHTGAGWVGSRALTRDPSLVPGLASAGQQGEGLGCSCMSWTIPAW